VRGVVGAKSMPSSKLELYLWITSKTFSIVF